jgi:hypothetical protein
MSFACGGCRPSQEWRQVQRAGPCRPPCAGTDRVVRWHVLYELLQASTVSFDSAHKAEQRAMVARSVHLPKVGATRTGWRRPR